MGHGGGHLSQRRKALAFGKPAFKPDVFLHEATVFDCNGYLAGEYLEHGPRIFRQLSRSRVDQQHAGNSFVAAKRIGDRISMSIKQSALLNRKPALSPRKIQQAFHPWLYWFRFAIADSVVAIC